MSQQYNCDLLTISLRYVQVMRSITDNITEDKLLEEINEISSLPMYADRKAHAKMAQHQAHAKMAQHRRR